MTVTVEEIGKYLGKPTEDAMGRPIGRLVGLTADIKDEVTAIQVAHNDGGVSQYPINFVKTVNGHIILLQNWRVEAEGLRKEHDIIRRRSQALDLLLKDGDIEQPEYNQLRNGYEDLNSKIDEKRGMLLDTLKQEEARIDQQIRDLQTALTNNKMLYTAAEIDEQTYHAVTESIRTGLEIARKERKDVANTREYLQGIDSKLDTLPKERTRPIIPDVVVIKMKDPAQA